MTHSIKSVAQKKKQTKTVGIPKLYTVRIGASAIFKLWFTLFKFNDQVSTDEGVNIMTMIHFTSELMTEGRGF